MLTSIKEHHAIVDAIRRADPKACEALMENHVQAAKDRLISLSKTGDNNHEQKGKS
jgi:DNA-binding GntR family transcriptional regulator